MEILIVIVVVGHVVLFALASLLHSNQLNRVLQQLRSLTPADWQAIGETPPSYAMSDEPVPLGAPLWAIKFGMECLQSTPRWAEGRPKALDSLRRFRKTYYAMVLVGVSLVASVALVLWLAGAL